jgi:hypothetical protein
MEDPTPPTITITAGVDQLAAVRAFVRTQVAAAGGDDETVTDLVQAVDELVCNVVEHGYQGRPGTVEIAFIETPDDIAFQPRSNKLLIRGVKVIARIEKLDYWDGER